MSRCIDLTGQKFGRLTVLKRTENHITKSGKNLSQWLCECECGNKIVVLGNSLKTNHTTSCGCKNGIIPISGKLNKRLYKIWRGMHNRCENPKSDKYRLYGGRGITICDEWQKFEPFCEWALSNGYRNDLSIDRIDGNKGYSPDNCRWVDDIMQNNNTSRNHYITYDGKTKTIAQWAREFEMSYSKLE